MKVDVGLSFLAGRGTARMFGQVPQVTRKAVTDPEPGEAGRKEIGGIGINRDWLLSRWQVVYSSSRSIPPDV